MTVRWGIPGCGDVCEAKSGPAFQQADGSELVAVMRRDRARAEDFARREEFALPNPRHLQQPFIHALVNELHGRGGCASTGASAARTSEVMDRALSSHYGSRAEGFWRNPSSWPGRGLARQFPSTWPFAGPNILR